MELKRQKKQAYHDLPFYLLMLLFPIAQFAIFYIGVNGRSFLYAFQSVDALTGTITWTSKPFVDAWNEMLKPSMLHIFGISFLSFFLTYSISTILALLFSYFIYKKLPCGNFFKVMLFLPSILSAIVMVTIYQNFVELAIPEVFSKWFGISIKGLIENTETRYGAIIFYNILVSFGTSVLMYSNAMSGISTEIIEAGKIDGTNSWSEFLHIILPSIFPTISTFIVTGVASIFVNQINLYSFFGPLASEDVQTYGYYLYKQTITVANNESQYPFICAIGLILTLIAVPLTLIVKELLERFGPSEE